MFGLESHLCVSTGAAGRPAVHVALRLASNHERTERERRAQFGHTSLNVQKASCTEAKPMPYHLPDNILALHVKQNATLMVHTPNYDVTFLNVFWHLEQEELPLEPSMVGSHCGQTISKE
jgi:hypothetical protein